MGNPISEKFADVLARRLSRRAAVAGAGAAVVATKVAAQGATPASSPVASPVAGSQTSFEPVPFGFNPDAVVAEGYTAVPFLKWGDPITADSPEFDPANITAENQAQWVGYNHDYVGFFPLPEGSNSSDHGIITINHEYTNPEIMWANYMQPNPDYDEQDEDSQEFIAVTTKEIVDAEQQAHGLTIMEIIRENGEWKPVLDSQYNRRITLTTPIELTGPVAGTDFVKTNADPDGLTVQGTLNNCAGGVTPWGTLITNEENFHQYFSNSGMIEDELQAEIAAAYGVPEGASFYNWAEFIDRYDNAVEPKEPNRFGYAVEVDPYDPSWTPKKRTGFTRTKQEGASTTIAPSGQAVTYYCDDQVFEMVYKFVSTGTYVEGDREANRELLAEGTAYVAKFNEDGTGEWMPLVFGEGELTEANGWTSQADVVVRGRIAARAVGGTLMDRPEDIEVNHVNNKVYFTLTKNSDRGVEDFPGVDAANPRPENRNGHIIELTEDGDDFASTSFTWDILILCGDPTADDTDYAGYPGDQVASPVSCPDNLEIDLAGNLWITTDGFPANFDGNDGLFVTALEGPERGNTKRFFSVPDGAECTGPKLTPDNTTYFVAIQHPGEGGTFENPIGPYWPKDEAIFRPALVVIQKNDGGIIGS